MPKVETIKKPWTPERKKDFGVDCIIYFILIAVSLTCVLPFIHVFSKSISTESYVIVNKVFLLPRGITLSAYQKIFSDYSILRSMYVSIVVTVTFTLIGMLITVCAVI